MNPSVRAIIQIPFSGSQGVSPAILLTLEKRKNSSEYNYLLPGGTMEDSHQRTNLQRELEEELNIRVSRRDMEYLYTYHSNRPNHLYLIRKVEYGSFRTDPKELKGIGLYFKPEERGLRGIPETLLPGSIRNLDREFYDLRSPLVGQYTEGLTIPKGYFNPSLRDSHVPQEVIPWDEQRKQWGTWEAESRYSRGIPPLDIS